jgi:hypothetical protein
MIFLFRDRSHNVLCLSIYLTSHDFYGICDSTTRDCNGKRWRTMLNVEFAYLATVYIKFISSLPKYLWHDLESIVFSETVSARASALVREEVSDLAASACRRPLPEVLWIRTDRLSCSLLLSTKYSCSVLPLLPHRGEHDLYKKVQKTTSCCIFFAKRRATKFQYNIIERMIVPDLHLGFAMGC